MKICGSFTVIAVMIGAINLEATELGPPSDVVLGDHMEALSPGNLTNGKQSIEELGFLEAQAKEVVAVVKVDTRPVALATVIAADGYFLTKASTLPEGSVPHLDIGGAKGIEAEVVEHFDACDLVLLKVPVSQLARPQWRGDIPPVSSWMVTPIFRDIPALIGVVSAKTRRIERPPAAIGIVMKEPEQEGGGVPIRHVIASGAGFAAGLQDGDVIMSLNGTPTTVMIEVADAVRSHAPGDTITLGIKREGGPAFDVEVELLDSVSTFYGYSMTIAGVYDPQADRHKLMNGQTSKRRAGFPLALQHDTPLRPREMGGPLLDLDGRVVGINIARVDRVACFALPCGVFLPMVREAIATHRSAAEGSASPKDTP